MIDWLDLLIDGSGSKRSRKGHKPHRIPSLSIPALTIHTSDSMRLRESRGRGTGGGRGAGGGRGNAGGGVKGKSAKKKTTPALWYVLDT